MKRTIALSAIFSIVGCNQVEAPNEVEPTNENLTLSELIDETTEEALSFSDEFVSAQSMAYFDCPFDDEEVNSINALLNLNADETQSAIETHAPYGLAQNERSDIVLAHKEYIINYDSNLRLPTYTSYRLDTEDIVRRSSERCFREDPRLDTNQRSTLLDYDEPVYQRGHLVPRADMNRTREVMLNTFVLSNIMPQHDNFNEGIWATFESAVRAWAKMKLSVLVVSGPLFDFDGDGERDDFDEIDRVDPQNNVAVPSHFFKIVLHERSNGFIESLAVVLPHTDSEVPKDLERNQELVIIQKNITSIDEIEAITGFDFFPHMPSEKQLAMERSIASELWY